jgi:subtilisin family serine protease
MNTFLKPLFITAAAILLSSCGTTAIVSTPIENIDNTPLKVEALSTSQKQIWGHLDLVQDTVPGMSVDKAYNELLKTMTGSKVIVAVIDSGIDISHEDLDGVVWTNRKEIPNNGIDDDKNGYVDDIHGWNFLGKSYNEQLEYIRILARGDTSSPAFAKAKKMYDEEYQGALQTKQRIDELVQQKKNAHATISAFLGKEDYTMAEVAKIESTDEKVAEAKSVLGFLAARQLTDKRLSEALEYYTDQLNYNLNKDFNGRAIVKDNPYDITDTKYGDNNVMPIKKSESHGTHVAGIIAAERNNGKGANGVANNVEIMAIRAVPNGDEYDKDIALAIRYAVDNGAKVINTSFGKSFSPNAEWVREAIVYAAKKDVLIVNAAGNDSKDLDNIENETFPNDAMGVGAEIADNFLTVGALAEEYGSYMVAGFSNYGKVNVDVFAPGDDIYSTTPENEYDFKGGTSMAAPATAGVAALIRSYYPKLSAAKVKSIIMESGLPIPAKVIVGGDPNNVKAFGELSKSAKMVNAYNAIVLASKTK